MFSDIYPIRLFTRIYNTRAIIHASEKEIATNLIIEGSGPWTWRLIGPLAKAHDDGDWKVLNACEEMARLAYECPILDPEGRVHHSAAS